MVAQRSGGEVEASEGHGLDVESCRQQGTTARPEARAGTTQAVVIARTQGAGFERSGETLIGEEAVNQEPRNMS